MHDQGVEVAVCLRVEVVYRQHVVTAVGVKQSLAFQGAIWSSVAHKAVSIRKVAE